MFEAISKWLTCLGSATACGQWAVCNWSWAQRFVAWLGTTEPSDWYGGAGLAVGVLGLVMNFVFNLRRDRRERAKERQ